MKEIGTVSNACGTSLKSQRGHDQRVEPTSFDITYQPDIMARSIYAFQSGFSCLGTVRENKDGRRRVPHLVNTRKDQNQVFSPTCIEEISW